MKKLAMLVALGFLVILFSVGTAALLTRAADHLDAPGLTPPGGDGRLDINDVYAFQSPNPGNTVLIMTVNPLAGVVSPETFHPKARYEFLIDNDGDAREDLRLKIRFSEPKGNDDDDDDDDHNNNSHGVQKVRLSGSGFKAKGITGENIPVRRDGLLHAGSFDDPFFFDLEAFLGSGGRSFCDGSEKDFFLGLNVSAIVLEVPSAALLNDEDDDDDDDDGNNSGGTVIGVWARTVLNGKQIDRMGRPAINTVFIPNNPFEPVGSEPSQKNSFNVGKPKNDQRDFRPEVVDTLELFYGSGNPTVDTLADILLPDILTFDTASSAGFLNGRRLADDVIDAELGLVTNGIVTSDCVSSDSAFQNSFPYLASAN